MILAVRPACVGLLLCSLGACADDVTSSGGSGAGGDSTAGPGGGGTSSGGNGTGAGAMGGSGNAGGAGAASSTGTGATTSTGGGPATCEGLAVLAGSVEYTLLFDGDDRTYTVHTPPGYTAQAGLPVVVVFHGYAETAEQIETISNMTPETDARGYIVVYPQGRSTSWNAGGCCGSSSALGVDDVGFVDAMVAEIASNYCVDQSRLFACGFSNGGMLSHRLACESSDTFAAVGAVAGTMAIEECTPTRPVPVMHFHGTSDFVVPYNGGIFGTASVADTVTGWTTRNGCTDSMVSFDQGDATCETHGGCSENATVTICTLNGGGHQWPGGESAGPGGTINMDIFASEALLDFFDQHPMN